MKSLPEIVAANKSVHAPKSIRQEVLETLQTAQASLRDALGYGQLPERQANNILNVDLPKIERAILRLRFEKL